MTKQGFSAHAPGRLVRNVDGNLAYIPDPLPPTIRWESPLVLAVSQANQKLGELAGMGRRLRSPRLLIKMFLRREAELSSKIEDTYARVQTLVLSEQIPAIENETSDLREVQNNFRTLEFALQSIGRRGLSRSLMKEMHHLLLGGVRGADKKLGRFRTVQAHIGRTGDIKQARFVPPPPHEVENCMAQLERYLKNDDGLPALVRVALAHYQFEAIHPFTDGNGRVGRAIALMQLINERLLPSPLINLSDQLESSRAEYYDRLLDVSQKGEWVSWIRFFVNSIAGEASSAIDRIERVELLCEDYHRRVKAPRASVLLTKLIDELFNEPSVTIRGAAKLLEVTDAAADGLLQKLVKAQIIREVTGKKRNRVYLAQEIVDLFSTNEH